MTGKVVVSGQLLWSTEAHSICSGVGMEKRRRERREANNCVLKTQVSMSLYISVWLRELLAVPKNKIKEKYTRTGKDGHRSDKRTVNVNKTR